MNARNRSRVILGGLIAVVLAWGGAPPQAGGAQGRNKAVAQRVFEEILNQGKYDVFAEIYAADFVKHVDRKAVTLEQEIKDARATRGASSDLVTTIDQMVAEGDRVAILYTGRGTNTGPLGQLPATGKKFVVSGMTLYRFARGKIAEEWTFYNMLDILNQIGYAPGPSTK